MTDSGSIYGDHLPDEPSDASLAEPGNPSEELAADALHDGRDSDGTTAVLRGMMTMLGEVLEALEERLAALERTIAAHEQGHAEAFRTESQARADLALEQLEDRLQRSLETNRGTASAVEAVVDRLDEVGRAVDTIGYGLVTLAESIEGRPDAEEAPPATQEDVRQVTGAVQEVGRDVEQNLGRVRQDLSEVAAMVRDLGSRAAATEAQLAAVTAALGSMEAVLNEHLEETSRSLGQKATRAGRRLASDLRLFSRTRHPGAERGLGRDG